MKYSCPVCNHLTLDEEPPGTYEVCPVCYWEDDPVQYEDPNFEGGANEVSMEQARKNFKEFGASSREFIGDVRPPQDDENQ